jgi:hypothetical protein
MYKAYGTNAVQSSFCTKSDLYTYNHWIAQVKSYEKNINHDIYGSNVGLDLRTVYDSRQLGAAGKPRTRGGDH